MATSERGVSHPAFAARIPVFSLLPPSDIKLLDSLGMEKSFVAQKEIFSQEDPANYVYRVREGRIKIMVTSAAGRMHILRVMYPGDVLGMSAVLAKVPYEASAITLNSAVIDIIPAVSFQRFLLENPCALACVARALSEEYLEIAEHAKLLQNASGTGARVARVLLSFAPVGECGLPFPFMFTHEDIGNMAGCSRESVTRMFASFRSHRLIATEGDHSLTILQREPLRVIAGLN